MGWREGVSKKIKVETKNVLFPINALKKKRFLGNEVKIEVNTWCSHAQNTGQHVFRKQTITSL